MTTEVNADLVRKVVAHIEEDPASRWDQSRWITFNCNTKFCFAGWAVVLSGLVDATNGAPTEAGLAFVEERGLTDPKFCDWDDPPQWDFPYSSAAIILLGLESERYSYDFHSLFDRFAAKNDGTLSNTEDPDNIEIFKTRITEMTGVTFP